MIDLDKLYSEANEARTAEKGAVRAQRDEVTAHIVAKMFEALGPLASNFERVPDAKVAISFGQKRGTENLRVPTAVEVEIRFLDWTRSHGRLLLFAQSIGGEPADVTNEDGEWEPGEIDYSKIQWRRFGFLAQNFKLKTGAFEIQKWIHSEEEIPADLVRFLRNVRSTYDRKEKQREEHAQRVAAEAETRRKRDIRSQVLKLEWEHRTHAKNEKEADAALAILEELAQHRDIDIETYQHMRGIWQLNFDADQKRRIVAAERRGQYVAAYVAFLEAFAEVHRFNVSIAESIQNDHDGDFQLFKITYAQMVGGEYGVEVDNRTDYVSTANPGDDGFYQVCDRYSGTYRPVKFFNIVTVEGPERFKISDGRFVDRFIDEDAMFWNFEEIVIYANHDQIEAVEKTYRHKMRAWPALPDPAEYGVKTSPDYPGEYSDDRSLRNRAIDEYQKKHDPDYVEDPRPPAF